MSSLAHYEHVQRSRVLLMAVTLYVPLMLVVIFAVGSDSSTNGDLSVIVIVVGSLTVMLVGTSALTVRVTPAEIQLSLAPRLAEKVDRPVRDRRGSIGTNLLVVWVGYQIDAQGLDVECLGSRRGRAVSGHH